MPTPDLIPVDVIPHGVDNAIRVLPKLVPIIDGVGTFVFALSGGLLGVQKRFDLFGVLVLAFVVAVAGGIMRDVMIGAIPPASIRRIEPFAIAMIGGLVSFLWHAEVRANARLIKVFDTIGLGLFAATGAQKALIYDVQPLMAAILGMVSGIGGGIVRDVLAGETPFVFVPGELYAVAALAGALVVAFGPAMGFSPGAAMLAGATLCVFLRVMSARHGWRIPAAEPDEPPM